MRKHSAYQEMLVLYTSGQLDEPSLADLEMHLAACPECRQELQSWRSISRAVTEENERIDLPDGLEDRVFSALNLPSTRDSIFKRTFNLLRAQAYLVRREMWPSSAILMTLAIVMTLLFKKIEILRFLSPMIAAGCLAAIFGQENDPAWELALSTPVSRWKILLARMTVVHGYNLILSVVASFIIIAILPVNLFWSMLIGWLGPLTFLSALALLLSMWLGTGNSVVVVYLVWILQYPRFEAVFSGSISQFLTPVFEAYRQFWNNPQLLIFVGCILFTLTLVSVSRRSQVSANDLSLS